MTYKEMKDAFQQLKKTLNAYPLPNHILMHEGTGLGDSGFTLEYADSKRTHLELFFQIDEETAGWKTELYYLQVEYEKQGRGSDLVRLALDLSKAVGSSCVYGNLYFDPRYDSNIMEFHDPNIGYVPDNDTGPESSVGFWEKMGATIIDRGNQPPEFRFDL